jgi:pseudaminic acid synthase
MNREFTIGKRKIGLNHPPFIVAELSGNHNGKLERALELVRKAKEAGVDAVKLQTYTADTITWPGTSDKFKINDAASVWNGRSYYDLYQEASLPWDWHEPIFKLCGQLDLICFSTPFDETAVDFLEALQVPCYKIASAEIVDLPLIRKAAQTGKPLIVSTGAATSDEIEEAVAAAKEAGCEHLVLLKCTAAYPAAPAEMHLRTLPHMAKTFKTQVGLSDHTLGTSVAIASVALGATLIEKHMTLKRSEGGVDSHFSLEPHEFKQLVEDSTIAWQALGTVHYGPLPSEKLVHTLRPSLFFVEDLPEGAILEAKHLRTLRPALGLPPKEIDRLIGKRLAKSVKKGTPVQWDYF